MNEYIEDERRGLVVFHDHFADRPHGGVAVFDVRSDAERGHLDDAGPLTGWNVTVHALTFSLTAVGFVAQTKLTLEGYGHSPLEELRAAEEPDPRFWWRKEER
ncbi:MAG TPA: hypothetical protein VE596_08200 [Gaiellaceae bacterium]|nr:hypothetical protein [Gaiellaceae bacterium]